jgi:hypothetical protein
LAKIDLESLPIEGKDREAIIKARIKIFLELLFLHLMKINAA